MGFKYSRYSKTEIFLSCNNKILELRLITHTNVLNLSKKCLKKTPLAELFRMYNRI